MKLKTRWLALAMLPWIASCGTVGSAEASFCQIARPIYISKADDITPATEQKYLIKTV